MLIAMHILHKIAYTVNDEKEKRKKLSVFVTIKNCLTELEKIVQGANLYFNAVVSHFYKLEANI